MNYPSFSFVCQISDDIWLRSGMGAPLNSGPVVPSLSLPPHKHSRAQTYPGMQSILDSSSGIHSKNVDSQCHSGRSSTGKCGWSCSPIRQEITCLWDWFFQTKSHWWVFTFLVLKTSWQINWASNSLTTTSGLSKTQSYRTSFRSGHSQK